MRFFIFIIFLWRCGPTRVMASLFLRSLDHTQRRTTVGRDSSGRVISSSQRPLPDNTQHSQQTNIHASGGIRTHDLSRRAAAVLRLRPRGYWDRHLMCVPSVITTVIAFNWLSLRSESSNGTEVQSVCVHKYTCCTKFGECARSCST